LRAATHIIMQSCSSCGETRSTASAIGGVAQRKRKLEMFWELKCFSTPSLGNTTSAIANRRPVRSPCGMKLSTRSVPKSEKPLLRIASTRVERDRRCAWSRLRCSCKCTASAARGPRGFRDRAKMALGGVESKSDMAATAKKPVGLQQATARANAKTDNGHDMAHDVVGFVRSV
jgi:hypothetical protein